MHTISTQKDVKDNLDALIKGLKVKIHELTKIMHVQRSFIKRAQVNNLRVKLSLEIHNREFLAKMVTTKNTVLRDPTVKERNALKSTLHNLNAPLDSNGSLKVTTSFIEDLMTQVAKCFIDTANLLK